MPKQKQQPITAQLLLCLYFIRDDQIALSRLVYGNKPHDLSFKDSDNGTAISWHVLNSPTFC